MQGHGFLRLGGILFVVSQMLGPGTVGAAESQRPPKSDTPRRAMVSGLRGDAQILSPGSTEPRPVRFRDAVNSGDQLTTGPGNLVEILVGRHALVTLHEESSLQFLEEAPGQTALQLIRGEARLAVARTEDTITIQTPTATAATRGGLIRVKVTPGKRQASQHDNDGAGHSIPIVFRNVVPVAAAAGPTGQIETFQVSEGVIQVKSSAPGSPLTTVEAGQNVQVAAGQVGKPSAVPPALAEKYSLPAAETHSRTSEAGIRNLVGQQRQQAEALQRVLLGPTDTERPLAKNAATGAIISTTGVIISTTGAALTQSQDQTNSAALFAPGGLFTAAALRSIPRSTTGIVDDTKTGDIEFLTGVALGASGAKSFSIKGGGALVVFDNHTIRAKSELVMVDSGDRRFAPHNGIPPTATLYVTPSPLLTSSSAGTPRDHTGLPLQIFDARDVGGGNRFQNVNRNAEVFIGSGRPEIDLLQYSRDNPNTPLVPEAQHPQFDNGLVVRTEVDGNGSFKDFRNPSNTVAFPNEERSLVDGIVRARSDVAGSSADRMVNITGGVILNNTRLIASFSQNAGSDPVLPQALQAPPNLTRQYFLETGQSEVINGSIVGIIAKRDGTQILKPAFAVLSARVLAVLDGSSLGPDSPATKIGLLSVLDSQLVGPMTMPGNRIGENGKDPGIPPLLETINSPGVETTSAVVVRSTGALNGLLGVDRGLLEASSPLVAMVNSTMTTSSHFADLSVAGVPNNRRLLNANLVPGDALVRLDASRLTVMGNLFNLANGATASVTGHLFSLTNGSSLTVNGALVSLTGNSALNLNSTAFGAFGPGANSLQIINSLCSSGCTAIAGFPALRVSGGGTVALPAGFIPFALQPGAPVPRVTIGPNAAAFHVDAQSQLNVTLRQ